MKKLLCIALVAVGCGSSKYKAPPAVPSIALPPGAQLAPFDAQKPGEARPTGIAGLGGKAYVTLTNYDINAYAAAGPGFLAVIVPSTGALQLIDLGGVDGKQCQQPGSVRAFGGLLYVACAGAFDGQTGAVLEVDPAAGTVKRAVHVDGVPYQVVIIGKTLWFGDALSDVVRALDLDSFAQDARQIALGCPQGTTGTNNHYSSVADVTSVDGDLYALCAADVAGTSTVTRHDPVSGAIKARVNVGPVPAALAPIGDGRLAVINADDNTLMFITPSGSTMTAQIALTYSSQTATLFDLRSSGGFLYSVASQSGTVQKIDPHAAGGAKVVGEANVGASKNPWNILPLDDDQALVTDWAGNDVVSVKW